MKKFLKEIFIYGTSALLLCFLIANAIYFLTGDNESFFKEYEICEVKHKLQTLEDHPKEFNTLFFGTSRTYRHIDPFVYDSLVPGSKSFNAGVAGLFPLRYFDFIDKAITSTGDQFENVVIELAPLSLVGQNYDSKPNVNSINYERYAMAMAYPWKNTSNKKALVSYELGYTSLFLYKYTGFGIAQRLKLSAGISSPDTEVCSSFDYYQDRGYYSLDQDLADKNINYHSLLGRKEGFQSNSTQEDIIRVYKMYTTLLEGQDVSGEDRYTEWLLQLINRVKPYTKKISFIIPPREEPPNNVSLERQKRILKEAGYCVLDYSDPDEYPGLYQYDISFDFAHFNDKGAKYYTRLLADELNHQSGDCRTTATANH